MWCYDIGSLKQEVDSLAMVIGRWLTGYEQAYDAHNRCCPDKQT
jgi:hypothetical protein